MIDPSILAEARDNASLVQIRTRFTEEALSAFPIEINEDLILFLTLDHGFHLDGLRALRVQDLTECLFPHPRTTFVEEVLALRGEDEIELPALTLESKLTLLETAPLHLPLLALYRQETHPDRVCVGRVLEVDESEVSILELDEQCVWATEASTVGLADLTRVDMGGARLEAFYLVSGEPD